MKLRIACAIAGFLLLAVSLVAQTASGSTSSQVPPLIPFSSVATDDGGNSLSGMLNITFALYAGQQGGAPLWTETQNNVQLDATGHYSVQLGITQPNGVPTALFTTGEARWLGVRIAEQGEQPRVLLLSVPYALKAGDAATIGGLPPSAFVLAAPGPASASPTFVVSGASSSDTQASMPTATDVTGAGTVNFIPLWTSTSNIANSVLFQSAASPFRIGINTTTPATTLDVKGAGTIRGILALPATAAATAAKGADSQPLNVVASAFNSTSSTAVNQTFQWQAEPAANDTASPSGTLNLLFGTGATKPSETGLHIASTGVITFNAAQTFPNTITGVTTAAGSGLTGGGTSGTLNLALTSACAKNQVLEWNGTAWACASPGTGTITGVTAGTDLTGGGTSGNVTLSLNTAAINGLYAQLGASLNTFTGSALFSGFVEGGQTLGPGNAAILGFGTNGSIGTFGSSDTGYGVQGVANSPSGFGVYGFAQASTGTSAGVLGTTNSTAGYGVEGAGPNIGVFGTTSTPGAIGVEGSNGATSDDGVGVQGIVQSPVGSGVVGLNLAQAGGGLGVWGISESAAGIGVAGFAEAGGFPTMANLDEPFGVVGANSTATGVYGASSGWSGFAPDIGAGVWGDTGSSSGYVGVMGTGSDDIAGEFANLGSTAATIYAVNETETVGAEVFYASIPFVLTSSAAIIGDPGCSEGSGNMGLQLGQMGGMSGCSNYTLLGNNVGDTYLNASSGETLHLRIANSDQLTVTTGNVDVLGKLSKGSGTFKIDHPLDPANKYLYHSFVESPDMKNIYDGVAELDGSGGAVITLPDWFQALNKDFRYQLTTIGGYAPVYIAQEVESNQFRIAGGRSGVKVSWQVTGIRQDAFANANPIQVEVEKAPADRGRYLYPEALGQPATSRIGYQAPPPGSEQIVHHRPALPRRSTASPRVGRMLLSRPAPPTPNLHKPILPQPVVPTPRVAPFPHPPVPANPKASTPPVQPAVQPGAAQPG
jgi:trimeric autotransporter adhesin